MAAGTKWELKHFVHVDEDPLCESLSLASRLPRLPLFSLFFSLTTMTDERLGKAFKASPPTEDMYVFQHNAPALGPSSSSSA